MKRLEEILTKEELDTLQEKGYMPLEVIGEGSTRYVIKAKYQSKEGPLSKEVVIKIPKNGNDIDNPSVLTLVNLAKGDINEKELISASQISHPNIINIVDTIKINSKTVNIEEYFDGAPLYKKKLDKKEKLKVIKQIIDGVYYLNEKKGILHRDLNPSNILVNEDGLVKIIDLQLSRSDSAIIEKYLPTHGGRFCADPRMLDAIVKGGKTETTKKSEVFALASIIYNLFSDGKFPSYYHLDFDENGNEVEIGTRKIKIVLKNNGSKIEFSPEEYRKELKKTLKQIPRKYRKMLYKGLSLDNKFNSYTVSEFKKDFEKANNSKISRYLWSALGITTLASAIIINAGKNKPLELANPFVDPEYCDSTYFEHASKSLGEDWFYICYNIKPKDIKEKIAQKQSEINNIEAYVDSLTFDTGKPKPLDKKAFRAILIAQALEDSAELKKIYGKDRSLPYLAAKNLGSLYWDPKTPPEKIKSAKSTFEFCRNASRDIEQAIVRYFTTLEENCRASSSYDGPEYFSDEPTKDRLAKTALVIYYKYDEWKKEFEKTKKK